MSLKLAEPLKMSGWIPPRSHVADARNWRILFPPSPLGNDGFAGGRSRNLDGRIRAKNGNTLMSTIGREYHIGWLDGLRVKLSTFRQAFGAPSLTKLIPILRGIG